MDSTSLFIGRFQPFHNGHLHVIRNLCLKSRLVKVGIGSSQCSRNADNPFSARERKAMIDGALSEAGISRYKIFFIPDVEDNTQWVEHVRRIVGAFDVLYSGNSLVLQLFKEQGIQAVRVQEVQPYSGTKIRELLRRGKDIQKLVPQYVLTFILSEGKVRIKN